MFLSSPLRGAVRSTLASEQEEKVTPLDRYRQMGAVALSVIVVALIVVTDIKSELMFTEGIRNNLYQQAIERNNAERR
jgi:hypothetical protein